MSRLQPAQCKAVRCIAALHNGVVPHLHADSTIADVVTPPRAADSALIALPEPLLHMILVRVPGRDAACAMSACRALAAAVRTMPEISLALQIQWQPYKTPKSSACAAELRALGVASAR